MYTAVNKNYKKWLKEIFKDPPTDRIGKNRLTFKICHEPPKNYEDPVWIKEACINLHDFGTNDVALSRFLGKYVEIMGYENIKTYVSNIDQMIMECNTYKRNSDVKRYIKRFICETHLYVSPRILKLIHAYLKEGSILHLRPKVMTALCIYMCCDESQCLPFAPLEALHSRTFNWKEICNFFGVDCNNVDLEPFLNEVSFWYKTSQHKVVKCDRGFGPRKYLAELLKMGPTTYGRVVSVTANKYGLYKIKLQNEGNFYRFATYSTTLKDIANSFCDNNIEVDLYYHISYSRNYNLIVGDIIKTPSIIHILGEKLGCILPDTSK